MPTITYPFDTPANYAFDSDKIEVTGGFARLKDQRPADGTFNAHYTTDINGTWGDGDLTGTAIGGASVVDGKLDLKGGMVKYVNYDADLNADSQQTGCIRFGYIPDYVGSPADEAIFFSITKAHNDITNNIYMRHSLSGALRLHAFDSTGALIFEKLLGTWLVNSGQEYEIEINYDLTTGASRVFIDGTQFGTTETSTGIRDSSISLLRVGAGYQGTRNSRFEINGIIIYSAVQHTADYTPTGEYEIDQYPIDNPTITPLATFLTEDLLTFINTVTETGSDSVKYAINVDGTDKWWNGLAIADSTGYSESNTAAEITANISEFLSTGGIVYPVIYLHSDSGNTTPSISDLTITYDFYGGAQDNLSFCSVYLYSRNPDGTVCTDEITVTPSAFNIKYKTNVFICQESKTVTPDATTGYVEISLLENINMLDAASLPVTYIVTQNRKQIANISVPDQPGALLWDILV